MFVAGAGGGGGGEAVALCGGAGRRQLEWRWRGISLSLVAVDFDFDANVGAAQTLSRVSVPRLGYWGLKKESALPQTQTGPHHVLCRHRLLW